MLRSNFLIVPCNAFLKKPLDQHRLKGIKFCFSTLNNERSSCHVYCRPIAFSVLLVFIVSIVFLLHFHPSVIWSPALVVTDLPCCLRLSKRKSICQIILLYQSHTQRSLWGNAQWQVTYSIMKSVKRLLEFISKAPSSTAALTQPNYFFLLSITRRVNDTKKHNKN